MGQLNKQFECIICGNSFDMEEEMEPNTCGHCSAEEEVFPFEPNEEE